jgi:hypothetical protein
MCDLNFEFIFVADTKHETLRYEIIVRIFLIIFIDYKYLMQD